MQPRGGAGGGDRGERRKGGSLAGKAAAKRAAAQDEFPTGEALDQALNELEKKIERVRTLYEQYFMGIEKMEPQVARKEVTRTMLLYAQQHIRNTGQRFRFHSMQQKWNIYITLWNRTMREIEAGTYKRDVARVTRKLQREGKSLPEQAAIELKVRRRRRRGEMTPTPVPIEPSKPVIPPPRAPTPPPRPGVSAAPGVSEDAMRALYRRYVQAKKLVADPNANNIKYESLVATVARQTPQIMQKYGVEQVEFTVVIREDKVVLKAIPKKA